MIGNYLKELSHWLHLAFFKPVTLQKEAERLTKKQKLAIYLQTFPVGFLFIPIFLSAIGLGCELVGIPFDWTKAFGEGLVFGLAFGLGVGLLVRLVFGLGDRLGDRLFVGLGSRLFAGLGAGLGGVLFGGLGGVLFVGLFVGPGELPSEALRFLVSYLIMFSLSFFRPFHLLPHLIQYWRSGAASNPFALFRNSPAHWDEVVAMPLPFLSRWLVKLAQADREQGLAEISFIAANRPFQRRAARKALIAVVIDDLRQVDSIEKLSRANELLKAFPAGAKYLPAGFDEARRRISDLAANARRYESGELPTKVILLQTMVKDLEAFRSAIAQTPPPIGANFYPLAERWLGMVKAAEEELRRRLAFTPIKNPFVAGNALQDVDGNLFKGRRDIIRALEENIIHPQQRTALLLYGRRRIGKSSTLLNLPNLMSAAYIPVYIDLQEGKWRESDGMFCYHLVRAVYHEMFQLALHDGLKPPSESDFEQRPFTRLAEYLDRVEEVSLRIGKQILITFDEYERMEVGIEKGRITLEVLNQLRHLVQHRRSLVLLFSGSHQFEELKTVNWADYLINTKTLELSYLEPDEARELMERPAPEFNLRYEAGVIDRILELTHCQPYLLQAIGSELVNHLNTQNRMTATMDDLNVVVEKTLVSAQAYFHYTWANECADEEREILLALATEGSQAVNPGQHRAALQNLLRKEIVESGQDGYRLSIEMFRLWILKNEGWPTQPAAVFRAPEQSRVTPNFN